MNYTVSRCLIIPDVHQNIAWAKRVLAAEPACDLVVFLGDYFDSHRPTRARAGVAATSDFLNETKQHLGVKVVPLLGNHDIQYLEAKPWCDRHRTPRHLFYKCGSAYSHAAASKIAADFWTASRLFVVVNGWLLSHAGVHATLWPVHDSLPDSIKDLEQECARALTTMRREPHPLLQAGKVRGGDAANGGITWQDFDIEFRDSLPLPQIVGHTPSDRGARTHGRSWCLDGGQTCYGVLENETLVVKTL